MIESRVERDVPPGAEAGVLPTRESPPLHIGSLALATPVISAPIAGFTDLVFRRLVRDFGGCGLIYTEMVSAGGWVQGQQTEPERLHGVRTEPGPLGVQLWDREPAMVEEGARRLRDYGVAVIDLNFGCPKQRIMGKQGAGAKLLRDPETVGRMVAATVRGAGGIPVTAKIRLGPSANCRTATAVARQAAANGAVAITVHGRTAGEGYGTPSRFDLIGEVVAAVDVPVIANGDIVDAPSAMRALRLSGAAGVMVARAALTRPWVFREITAALRGEAAPRAPSLLEQREQLLAHHAAVVDLEGDPAGTIRMRKFACRYLAGVRGARAFRARIALARDADDFRRIVSETFPDVAHSGDTTPFGDGGVEYAETCAAEAAE
ncbi:MAG: tRNA dihydrouridine synthase [Planctomycetota bacterium]